MANIKIHHDLPSSKDTKAYQRAMSKKIGKNKRGQCECGFTGMLEKYNGAFICARCKGLESYHAQRELLRRRDFTTWWRRFGPLAKYRNWSLGFLGSGASMNGASLR